MHISIETVTYILLVACCVIPPFMSGMLFFSALSAGRAHKATRYVSLGMAAGLIIIWLPVLSAMPVITQRILVA